MVRENIGVRAFISYARVDNVSYAKVVDHLKADIEARFHAHTGRKLEIFVDRDSIGWGVDWRSKIRDSVRSATFFLPIVTMRFFESEACRDELITFYENARQLGVTELILPIVLAGADRISSEDERSEVQLIDRLNYKNIEDAWIEGYESAAWNRLIQSMVKELASQIEVAESSLAAAESAAIDSDQNAEPMLMDHDQDQNEQPADLMALGTDVTELTEVTHELRDAMESFTSAAQTSSWQTSGLSQKQQQSAIVRMAHTLRKPAEDLFTTGSKLQKKVASTDVRLRAIVSELRSIDIDQAQQQLNSLLESFSGLEAAVNVPSQLAELTKMLQLTAVMNVSMRASVKPAVAGLQAVESALSIIQSWQELHTDAA